MTKQQIISELRRLGLNPRVKATKGALEIMLRGAQKSGRTLPEKTWPVTRKAEDVTPARAGTKRALILEALHRGCAMDDLMRITGWNRSTCQSAITTDVQGAGYGVRRDASGKLTLLLPRSMKRPAIVEPDQDRETARVAACR